MYSLFLIQAFFLMHGYGINKAMPDLSKLPETEAQLIISLPYRVGLWISYVDDNQKTNIDDKRERQALEKAIDRLAKAHRKMPFAAQVMQKILLSKNKWDTWHNQAAEEVVLGDLDKAMSICREKLDAKKLSQYKHAIWQIGVIVAQSYGEQIDPDNEMHMNRFAAWIGSFISAPSLRKAPENMSAAEKTALKKLRAVLKQ